ncbi:hypothetical protein ACIOJD_34375 [Streptomyces sp. NPDC088116]|uniref:hypothetical protein n=1 Tax=Streptomyces sp. NPDC088116 TaxID=3365825 RepID=UPI003818273C
MALVHDPANPDPTPDPGQDPAGASLPDHPDADAGETATELVEWVIAWYSQHILAERRAGAGPQRLKELIAQRQACIADRDQLTDGDADVQEVARLTAVYAARLKELRSSTP